MRLRGLAHALLARHHGRLALEITITAPGHAPARVAVVLSSQ